MNKINLKGLKSNDWARLVFMIFVLILAAVEIFRNGATIEAGVISALNVVTMFWTTWKNFNVTKAAQIAQETTDKLKSNENYVIDEQTEYIESEE